MLFRSSQSGLNDSVTSFTVDPGKSHTLVLSGSGAFVSYIRVNDVQNPTVSIIETSSFNSNITTQFTPEANKSYNVVYTMTDNSFASASAISWSYYTYEASTAMKASSYCLLYDTYDGLYYVSQSGENTSGSFNAVSNRILSASVFGTGSTYTTQIVVNSVISESVTQIYLVSQSAAPSHLAFTGSNGIAYQVSMGVIYPEV